MPSLPPEYVPVLRQKLRRVVKRMHADYSQEIEAAYARGLAEGRDEVVVGLKALAKLNGSGAAVMDMARVVKAAAHAPAGGVTVQGKEYRGGEFIPGEVMEKATKEEKDAVHGAKGKAKEPHEMTSDEYVEQEKPKRGLGSDRLSRLSHEQHVRDARSAGKHVPWHVIESVPSLRQSVEPGNEPMWTRNQSRHVGQMVATPLMRSKPFEERKAAFIEQHRSAVARALEKGERVPADVLADYPDLVEKYQQATQPASNVGSSTDENPTKVAQSPAIRTVERTRKLLASDKPLSQVIAAVQLQLEGHTHAELAEIKAHLGIKAGGAKAEMARKIALRAASVDKTNRRHYTHQAMSVDQVHDLIQSHKHNGTLDTADGIRSVVQAIGTGLTVKQVAELKQRLGVKAGGAKHEMATKIALRAAQEKKPVAAKDDNPVLAAQRRFKEVANTKYTDPKDRADAIDAARADLEVAEAKSQGAIDEDLDIIRGGRPTLGSDGKAIFPNGRQGKPGDTGRPGIDRSDRQPTPFAQKPEPVTPMGGSDRRLAGTGAAVATSKINTTVVTQNPGGGWGCAGKVDPRLVYSKQDGTHPTQDEVKQVADAAKFGGRFGESKAKQLGLKYREFSSEQEAQQALNDLQSGGGNHIGDANKMVETDDPTQPPAPTPSAPASQAKPEPVASAASGGKPKATPKPTTDHAATASGLKSFIGTLPGGKATKEQLDAALAPLDTHDKGQLLEIAKQVEADAGLTPRSTAKAIRDQIKTALTRRLKTSQNVNHDDPTGDLEHAKREAEAMGERANGGVAVADNSPTKPDRSWTKNEDGTYTTPSGQVWRKANAGGETSPVNGKFFAGGSLMPIHGKSVKPQAEFGTGGEGGPGVGRGGIKERKQKTETAKKPAYVRRTPDVNGNYVEVPKDHMELSHIVGGHPLKSDIHNDTSLRYLGINREVANAVRDAYLRGVVSVPRRELTTTADGSDAYKSSLIAALSKAQPTVPVT